MARQQAVIERHDKLDIPFAQVPAWLMRAEGLSHAQYRILSVLIFLLHGAPFPRHCSYVWLGKAATTDKMTVANAMTLFKNQGFLIVSGRQQRRKYVLDFDKIRETLWTENLEDPDA